MSTDYEAACGVFNLRFYFSHGERFAACVAGQHGGGRGPRRARALAAERLALGQDDQHSRLWVMRGTLSSPNQR
jgi:hypothetical protein